MSQFVRRNPMISWWIVAIVGRMLIAGTQPAYDSGGPGALLKLTFGVWGFPIWLPLEMGLGLAGVVGALGGCALIDWLLRIVVSRLAKSRNGQRK